MAILMGTPVIDLYPGRAIRLAKDVKFPNFTVNAGTTGTIVSVGPSVSEAAMALYPSREERWVIHAPNGWFIPGFNEIPWDATVKNGRIVVCGNTANWYRALDWAIHNGYEYEGPRGVVYLMRAEDGIYKIGLSLDPGFRKSQLEMQRKTAIDILFTIRWSNPLELEAMLHNEFASQCVQGREWFNLSEDDVAAIRALAGAA